MSIPIATPIYTLGEWQGNVRDDHGIDWVVEEEQGWSSNPPVRSSNEDKTTGDGTWTGPGFYAGRVVTLSGKAIGDDPIEVLRAKERVKDALDARRETALVVTERHLERTALVRESTETEVSDEGPLAFSWTLTAFAGDSRRYSTTVQSDTTRLPSGSTSGFTPPMVFPLQFGGASEGGSGSVWMVQDGNYDETPAVITFYGPLITPRVEHVQSGKALSFDVELSWSDTLVVDLGKNTALLNGSSARSASITTGAAWFMLVRGRNELRFRGTPGLSPGDITPTPVPKMRVDFASAWK